MMISALDSRTDVPKAASKTRAVSPKPRLLSDADAYLETLDQLARIREAAADLTPIDLLFNPKDAPVNSRGHTRKIL